MRDPRHLRLCTGAAYAEQLAAALVTRATLPGFDSTALEAADLPQRPVMRLNG
ncbi:hypothetical protein ACGFWE_20595 [Streptomyces sp. NPDC048523]|uniref:hypothetical protein n=1 Tax=Streptomyces sp. NPDC048523 TaxID=3365567 RepID=UPI00371F933D